MWLEYVYLWRLEREEKEAMSQNEKITGKPKGLKQENRFGDLYPDIYRRAEENCYEIIAREGLDAISSHEQVVRHGWSETWLEEIATRVTDDYKHRKWQR